MPQNVREKFATQVDADILATVRGIAKAEGRQIQALVGEIVSGLTVKRRQGKGRAHVMAAYQASHQTYAGLYKKLAE